jgi:hypothetical protein
MSAILSPFRFNSRVKIWYSTIYRITCSKYDILLKRTLALSHIHHTLTGSKRILSRHSGRISIDHAPRFFLPELAQRRTAEQTLISRLCAGLAPALNTPRATPAIAPDSRVPAAFQTNEVTHTRADNNQVFFVLCFLCERRDTLLLLFGCASNVGPSHVYLIIFGSTKLGEAHFSQLLLLSQC